MITKHTLTTYAQVDDVIEANPGKLFVVEVDNGIVWGSRHAIRREFDALAPGESFTLHATCDWTFEAEAERQRLMVGGGTMIRTLPPSAHPTFVAAFAATIAGSQGQVCATCGLGRLGHNPESRWLGHAEHPWTPIAATASDLERANRLTSEAYRRHNRRAWT